MGATRETFTPRILYFTNTELFWECGSVLANEAFPERLPKECSLSDRIQKTGSLSDEWERLITTYSQTDLTVGSDKLAAISGIARVAQRENNDDYFAGMWRNEMEAQLCWCLADSGTKLPRTESYRAPSWSWASVDGYIPYRLREPGPHYDDYLAHVLDAWVIPLRPESTDVFGQLGGGTVVISCSSILSGKLTTYRRPRHCHTLEVISATPFQISVVLDFKDEDEDQTFYLLPLVAKVSGDKSEHSWSTNDGSQVGQSEGCRRNENDPISDEGIVLTEESGCSVPFERENVKNDESNLFDEKLKAVEGGRMLWSRVEGLLLRPSGSKKGEFSRKGWFGAGDTKAFAKALSTHGAATAESCCAQVVVTPKHPDEQYLITII